VYLPARRTKTWSPCSSHSSTDPGASPSLRRISAGTDIWPCAVNFEDASAMRPHYPSNAIDAMPPSRVAGPCRGMRRESSLSTFLYFFRRWSRKLCRGVASCGRPDLPDAVRRNRRRVSADRPANLRTVEAADRCHEVRLCLSGCAGRRGLDKRPFIGNMHLWWPCASRECAFLGTSWSVGHGRPT